jgi:hypothetical protein
VTLARKQPRDLISMMDNDFNVIDLLGKQLHREYTFGDILVARRNSPDCLRRGAIWTTARRRDRADRRGSRVAIPDAYEVHGTERADGTLRSCCALRFGCIDRGRCQRL